MTEFEAQVLSDLGVLKCQMEQVMGIGQPGRLNQMEQRMTQSEQSMHKMKGAVGAFGGLLTVLHVAISYFGGKHT
jgi:hypothetical protein